MPENYEDELDPGIPVAEEPPVQSVPVTHYGGLPVLPPDQRSYSAMLPGVAAVANARPPMTDSEAMWEQMRRDFGGLPLAQAERAVQSALKFQGMRTYQRALEQGKSAEEALAAAGPMMFGSAGMRGMTMTPYQQAQNAIVQQRLALAQQVARQKASGAQGVWIPENKATGEPGHWVQPGGAIVHPASPRAGTDPFALAEFRSKLQQIAELEKAIPTMMLEDRPVAQAQLAALRQEAAAMRPGGSRAASPTAAPTMGPGPVLPPASGRVSIGGMRLGGAPGPPAAPTAAPTPAITAPAIAPPKVTGKATSSQRVLRAKELREQYPHWTKQEILDAVNREMP